MLRIMSSIKKFFFIFLLIFSNLLHSKDYEVLDKIIATVEKDVITRTELQKEINKKFSSVELKNISKIELNEINKNLLEFLINKKLINQFAEQMKLSPSELELNQVLTNIIKNNNISIEELEKDLFSQGSSLYEFQDDLKHQLTVQKIKDSQIMPFVNISNYEIDAWLKEKNNQSDVEYKILHILIKSDNLEKDNIIDEIKKSINAENFSDIAKKYSQGPNAINGGDLGWKKAEDLPSIFSKFVLNAKVSEISKIIESSNGYHIIMLDSKSKIEDSKKIFVKQFQFQQILLKINTITSDDELRLKLSNIKNLIISGLNFSDAISKYSDDQFNKDTANLEWVNYDNLLPKFREQLNKYPQEKIIGPFKTELGWHLLKVINFRESDQTNQREREVAKIELARKKTDLRFQDWLNGLRKNSEIKLIDDN